MTIEDDQPSPEATDVLHEENLLVSGFQRLFPGLKVIAGDAPNVTILDFSEVEEAEADE